MIITFAGHRDANITGEIENKLKAAIINNLGNEKTIFYCGGYGAFDNAAAKTIKALKEDYPNIESIFVTPYLEGNRLQEFKQSFLYDEILYPDLESVPRRFAISRRNKFMVESAELIIAYVNVNYGGAYEALQLAKRKGKKIINLCEE